MNTMEDPLLNTLQQEGNRTEEERQRMRGFLQQYADMNPVRSFTPASHPAGIFRVSLVWLLQHRNATVAAFVVAFLVLGSTSYAAERALPGDFLYPMKIGVNEKLQGVFAVGVEEDADWDLELAHRRAQEVIALAQQNKLDDKTREDLESQFDAKLDRYGTSVATFEKNGNSEVAARLTSDLTLQLTKLDGLLTDVQTSEKDWPQIKHFKAKVESRLGGYKKTVIDAVSGSMNASTTASSSIQGVVGHTIQATVDGISVSATPSASTTSTSTKKDKDEKKDEKREENDEQPDDEDAAEEESDGDGDETESSDDSDEPADEDADLGVDVDVDVDVDLGGSSIEGSPHL